jgi:hypothetical protein
MNISQVFVGIDNGVTGSLGIITSDDYKYFPIPTFKQQDYTKKKKVVTRINVEELRALLSQYDNVQVAIERPMVTAGRFNSSLSAVRALEAVLIVVEELKFPYMFLDSKTWAGELLPVGTRTSPELKMQSYYIGSRLFPKVEQQIIKQKDADGILIAEYCKRFHLGTLQKKLKRI